MSILQERELADKYVWSYGYRYERARTFNTGTLDADDIVTVSPLTTTLTREGRDEVLDASTGSFLSHAFSYSPDWLGSTLPFFRYFGQYFYYLPLQAPQRRPFTNEILRPRLVFATGVRVGLGWGSGVDIPLSERFFAGGSTTLRGFAQNAVGPLDLAGTPRGGQALLVINNELRVPLLSRVDGVALRRHRQRLRARVGFFARGSSRIRRRRVTRSHALVPAPRRLRRSSSIAVRTNAAAASISASDRRSSCRSTARTALSSQLSAPTAES